MYGPPYGAYDPYYGNGGYASGPPVGVNIGLGYYGGNDRRDYGRDGRGHGRRDRDDRRDQWRDRH